MTVEKTFKGVGVVWMQGGKNIKFIDGTYTTRNPRELERLKAYPVESTREIKEEKIEPKKPATAKAKGAAKK